MRVLFPLAVLLIAVVVSACPDDVEAVPLQACVPGAVVACACDAGTIGTQTCSDDGAAFDACACTCEPLSCEAADLSCGVLDDGCGGTLVCGTCADDERCDDGTCVCAEGLVRDDAACVVPAVDSCGLGLDDCARDARCDNAVDGFTCTCLPGFVGDGRVCIADLCGQGLDPCDDEATCTNTDAGAQCACRAGYVGDGLRCVPGPDAIADLSDTPAVLFVTTSSGQVTALVDGLSRVGWDIPVTSVQVPRNDGSTLNRKFPAGPATFPIVHLRSLRGLAFDVNAIATEAVARAADNGTLSAVLALSQPGGGVLAVNIAGRVSAVDRATVVDGTTVVLAGFDWQPTTITLSTFNTRQPTFAPVQPGYILELEGVGVWPMAFDDTDGVPRDGPFISRRVQPIVAVMNKAIGARTAAQAGQDPRTVTGLLFAFSLITVQHTGVELGRRNGFETWASNVSIFTPDEDAERSGLQVTWQIDIGENG